MTTSDPGATVMRLLEARLVKLHPEPTRISHDPELAEVLLGLYGDFDPNCLWSTVIAPYLSDHERGLRNVWKEHTVDGSWDLLDRPEALLLFERADRDREKLRRVWPGPASSLARLSDVWGVPL